MGKIQRAGSIYRSEGMRSLLSSIRRKLKKKYYNKLRVFRANAVGNGTITHSIGTTSITVPVETDWQSKYFVNVHNERLLLEDMVAELDENDVVYDVGAYLGWHTVTAASVIDDDAGSVVAFEPHPVSYRRLRRVLERVVDQGATVRSYERALSDVNESIRTSKRSSGQIQLSSESNGKYERTHIEAVSGDEFIQKTNLSQPTVVKIDVEGWEVAALRGLETAISSDKCRLVYCEIHPQKAPEGEDTRMVLTEILESAGFEIESVPHERKSLIKATR